MEERRMTKERDRLEELLNGQYAGGTLSTKELITTLVQYDAAHATKVMARYTLASTIIAAISAAASASAAYLSYAALQIAHNVPPAH